MFAVCEFLLLTFVISKLHVVVHGGYKLLHKETANIWNKYFLTFYFTLHYFKIEIWGRKKRKYNKITQLMMVLDFLCQIIDELMFTKLSAFKPGLF